MEEAIIVSAEDYAAIVGMARNPPPQTEPMRRAAERHAARALATRIPLISGDEMDALSRHQRVHTWHRGERKRIKRGYWRRFRAAVRLAMGRADDGR